MQAIEKHIASNLITSGIAKGYLISVNNGEEWTVKRSNDFQTVFDALGTTELFDKLVYRDSNGAMVGTVTLIFGNGEDLIYDHCCNFEIDEHGVIIDWHVYE